MMHNREVYYIRDW